MAGLTAQNSRPSRAALGCRPIMVRKLCPFVTDLSVQDVLEIRRPQKFVLIVANDEYDVWLRLPSGPVAACRQPYANKGREQVEHITELKIACHRD